MKLISILIGLLILPAMVYQEKTVDIKGYVVDEFSSVPLEDGHVYVKGTNIGTVTDENGKFELQVPQIYSKRPLVVSFVGYENYEAVISDIQLEEYRIEMGPQVMTLREVVVTPGKHLEDIDQANDNAMTSYETQEEMLYDFYEALFAVDKDLKVLKQLIQDSEMYN